MWVIPCSLRSAYSPGWECSTADSQQRLSILASSIAQSVFVNGKPARSASLLLSWKRNAWTQRLFGRTLLPSQESSFAEWLTSFTAGFHVSRIPLPEQKKECRTSAGCGTTSQELFGTLIRGSFISKTCQDSLLPEDLPLASQAFPKWGSMRSGAVYRRQPWVPATSAKESSFWPSTRSEDVESCGNHPGATDSLTGAVRTWGTPRATDSFRSRSGDRKDEMGLDQQSRFWTTPQAHDVTERGSGQIPTAAAGNACLARDARTWPSPAARDYRETNSEEHAAVTGKGRKHMDQLANFVVFSPPAQAISDGPKSSGDFHGSRPPSCLTLMSELAQCNSVALCDLPLLGKTGARVVLPRGDWLNDLHCCLQKPRLNPAFAGWLMGLPPMWAHPELTNFVQLEMESYRRRQRSHLSSLLEGLE